MKGHVILAMALLVALTACGKKDEAVAPVAAPGVEAPAAAEPAALATK